MGGGTLIETFLEPLRGYLKAKSDDTTLTEFTEPLAAAAQRLEQAARSILDRASNNPAETGAAAVDFLQLFGLTALAFEWARMAEIGLEQGKGDEALFYGAKVRTARFFMQRILPRSEAHYRAIVSGSGSVMDFDDRSW
jgi:butyryl-CoA dehydrogenase